MSGLELLGINQKENEEDMNITGENIENKISPITEDGSLDRKGNPALKSKTGTWKAAVLLLVNYGLVTFAFFGVGVNLVLFLTRVMEQDIADAANNVSKWTGTVYIFSLVGAFLSDSYWGRYLTCAVFQLIFVLGLVLLSLSSWLLLVKPSGCGNKILECNPVSTAGTITFYISIYLIALGNGGYLPTIATFGSDQFDERDLSEQRSKVSFFSFFYVALNAGCLFSNTILAHYEDVGEWVIGFWASAGAAALALLIFLLGSPIYRHFKPSGNPVTRITQVFVAAIHKWGVKVPQDETQLFELEGKESAIAGSRKIVHSASFRFLDKAATVTGEERSGGTPTAKNPWKLCTVTQVEEVKCVLKMLPIWACTIIYSVVFTQMASLFVEQGAAMNTRIGSFNIPAASMSVFDILSVILTVFLYRRFLMPLCKKLTKSRYNLPDLHRMGIGLVIGMLSMVSAGVVELARLRKVSSPEEPSSLTIMWQIPQYALIGASEVFMYVAQLEFFNGQAPDGIKSFGTSLCMASISFGNYVSMMLVSVVMLATKGGNRPGWIPGNLNYGHLDRFYFLLAALTAVDFVIYIVCAKQYKSIQLDPGGDADDQARVGLVLLSLSSWLLLVKPSGCGNKILECNPVSTAGTITFYISIYLIALGNGGYLPTIATFGSDQFDERDLSEQRSKVSFFSFFYVALNAGCLFSNTILAHYEDVGEWVIGFWASAGAAALALLIFLLGSPIYRHFKPSGNPVTRITQVFVAAIHKWGVKVPQDETQLFELEGKESAIAGSRKIVHSASFRFLDKAATVTGEERSGGTPTAKNPWKLCTVTQVEEVKCVLKMLPIWACTIIYSVVFTQMASLFVEQGAAMNTRIGSFNIPAASMSVFDILSVILTVFLYRRFLMPLCKKLTKSRYNLPDLHRMGIGLVIGMLSMVSAGVVELARLRKVSSPEEPSSLTIMWQIPQYALIGASEVFMYVAQLEFFNGQAPDGIKSFGTSLCMASISFGNYVSMMLVSVVMLATKGGNRPGWIPGNLNYGHLDRFYFLLAALTAVDFVIYIVCAKQYKCIQLDPGGDADDQARVV